VSNTRIPGCRGVYQEQNLTIELSRPPEVTEDAAHAWYSTRAGRRDSIPGLGKQPGYTGRSRLMNSGHQQKYSWSGNQIRRPATEVGPLSRMSWLRIGSQEDQGSGRHGAPEAGVAQQRFSPPWEERGERNRDPRHRGDAPGLDRRAFREDQVRRPADSQQRQMGPSTWPKRRRVSDTTRRRGALCHWVVINDGKVAIISAWFPAGGNSSPRDAKDSRGPYEAALVDTPRMIGQASRGTQDHSFLRPLHGVRHSCGRFEKDEIIKVKALRRSHIRGFMSGIPYDLPTAEFPDDYRARVQPALYRISLFLPLVKTSSSWQKCDTGT